MPPNEVVPSWTRGSTSSFIISIVGIALQRLIAYFIPLVRVVSVSDFTQHAVSAAIDTSASSRPSTVGVPDLLVFVVLLFNGYCSLL